MVRLGILMRSRPEKKRLHKLDPKVHWSRVLGYVQLEIYEEARIELSMIPDDENWAKQKRMMEVEIFQHQEDWNSMVEVAHGLRMEFPDEVQWWIADAYATRRNKSIQEAREILLEALVCHYEDGTIRYNLACYACKLGSMGECMDFLKEAAKRDERFKLMAMEDEDLESVRETLRQMGWGDAVV
jgi:lipopolysaccharide biosynthesis regulator YciM